LAALPKKNIALYYFLLLSIVSTFGGVVYGKGEPSANWRKTTIASSQNLKQDGLDVDEIVQKSLTAYGGRKKLMDFGNDVQLSGQITYLKEGRHSYPYKHARKEGRWRTDSELPPQGSDGDTNRTQITAFDGATCWESFGAAANPVSPGKAKWLIDAEKRQPFLLTSWMEPGFQFKLLGPTNYKSVPVWALEVEYVGEPATTLYLDQTNYLVTAITYRATEPEHDKSVNVAIEYSEYRPANGIIWPYRQTRLLNDQALEQIDLSECTNAEQLASDYFSMPGAGQTVRLGKVISVPFDYTQREIVCKGRIEDSDELVLLFDTGSSETIVDRRVAAQLFLAKGADFKITTMGGDVASQTTTIKRLEIGNLIANDVAARLLDLSPQSRQLAKPIAAIIGMNVIGNYLVTIDYSKPSITFADAIAGNRPTDQSAVSFTQTTAPLVKVILPGNDAVECLMDTGAAFNHLPAAAARRHLGKAPAGHITEGTGLDGRALRLGTITIDPVLIGSQSLRRVSFTYPASGDGGQKDHQIEFGILGNPFWQNFVVTIDSRFQRLLLKSNPQAAIRSEMETAIANGDIALSTKRDFRTSEFSYQRALVLSDNARDLRYQAIAQGRLGNLRRTMAHDLQRPEHAQASYNYFSKADEMARKADLKDVEGRILADWSLLYSDNGQPAEARQAIDKAMLLAPQDATVNIDLAVHLFRQHLFPEAQKYIEKALFLDPGNWQALWYQLKLSETFADIKKEREILNEILKYYPWSKVAQEKLKSLPAEGK
jgi:predicted aspartyl protease